MELKKLGRPSKYKAEMCQTVIEVMSQGASKMEAAATIGVTEDTFYRWIKEKADFSEAIKEGSLLSQQWWEREMREAAKNNTGNATLFIFNMKNRFRRDWMDKVEHNIQSEDGSMSPPTTIRIIGPDE